MTPSEPVRHRPHYFEPLGYLSLIVMGETIFSDNKNKVGHKILKILQFLYLVLKNFYVIIANILFHNVHAISSFQFRINDSSGFLRIQTIVKFCCALKNRENSALE